MNLAFVVQSLGVSEQNYDLTILVEKINSETNKIVPYIFFQNLNLILFTAIGLCLR